MQLQRLITLPIACQRRPKAQFCRKFYKPKLTYVLHRSFRKIPVILLCLESLKSSGDLGIENDLSVARRARLPSGLR